jgi:hypothetical protein
LLQIAATGGPPRRASPVLSATPLGCWAKLPHQSFLPVQHDLGEFQVAPKLREYSMDRLSPGRRRSSWHSQWGNMPHTDLDAIVRALVGRTYIGRLVAFTNLAQLLDELEAAVIVAVESFSLS